MKSTLVICAIAVVLGSHASASVVVIDNVNPQLKNSAGDFVGPYNGRLDGVNYKIFCNDLDHNIYIGESVNVNVSTIDNLSKTRFGGLAGAASLYQQVFYLSNFLLNAGNVDRVDIQDAIWGKFSNNASNQATTGVMFWSNKAQNEFAGKDYSSFRILTDSRRQQHGKQELFVNTVPEPGTWAMLLTGAGALTMMRLRRKKA